MSRTRRVPVFVVAALLAGCQTLGTDAHEFGAEQREKLLQDAGFHIVPGDTPEKINALNGLPVGRISRVGRGGQIYYVYPDKFECHCLWVGNGEQYALYERLVADEMPGMDLEGPGAVVDAFGNGTDPWGEAPW